MGLSVTVKGQKQLQKLAEDLRRSKGTLRQELVRAFREAGEATLKKVKHNIETNPIRGKRTGRKPPFTQIRRGNDIRRRTSRVTELDISTSAGDPRVRFQVRTDRLGAERNLPYLIDSGHWRHPIMGNRHSWAGQTGNPWFYNEIRDDLKDFEAKADEAIDRTVEALEKG